MLTLHVHGGGSVSIATTSAGPTGAPSCIRTGPEYKRDKLVQRGPYGDVQFLKMATHESKHAGVHKY